MVPDTRSSDQLETCLQAIAAGVAPQSLIANYPDLRAEIEAAVQAHSLGKTSISPDIKARNRTRLLAHAAELRSQQRTPVGRFVRLPRLAIAALAALIVFLTGSGVVIASARSLPGDQLYPVKRAVEDFRLTLSSENSDYATIEAQYQERRIEEVISLLQQGRTELISFEGVVNEQGVRHWIVDEIRVIVSPETELIGQIDLGMRVEVKGSTQPEGWVRASQIALRGYEFSGIIESINNTDWIISGIPVKVDPTLEFDPKIQVGSQVLVQVWVADEGEIMALEIVFLSPPATSTPLPTSTDIPEPTETSTPTPEDIDDEVETPEPEDESESDEEQGEPEETESPEDDESEPTEETDEPEDQEENDSSENDSEDEEAPEDGDREDAGK